ncbi:MAG: oligosaccharide flippase family protein [archaeon]|nr:oligosaccharide flippase family protein [archaeon]
MKLKNLIGENAKTELIIGSFIIVSLTFLGNIFSYLFQFFMARMLGPSDYVVVAILTSIMALFAIPTLAIQTVISKKTTELKFKKEDGKIQGLMNSSLKKMFYLGLIFFILYSIFSIVLSKILDIKYIYLFLGGVFIFGAFTYPVLAGIIQGLKRFKELGLNFLLNCVVKFFVAISLVYMGFRIYGAILGFLSGMFLALIVLFYNIKSVTKSKTKKFEIKIFYGENAYFMYAMLIIVLMYSLDVIFAKAFFNSEIAGRYSVISLIGKTIFFVISSIGTAMFPINTERFVSGKSTKSVFRKAILLALIISISAVIIFSLFPHFIINILFGDAYSSASNLLVYLGIAFSFCSLLYLMILQNISMNKIKVKQIIGLSLFLILELSIFFLFHATIEQFSIGFMISNIIAFFGGYLIFKNG